MNGTESIGRSWDADGKGLMWEGRDDGSLWLAVKRLGQGLQAPRAVFCAFLYPFYSPGPSLHECDAKTIPSGRSQRRMPAPSVSAVICVSPLLGSQEKKINK